MVMELKKDRDWVVCARCGRVVVRRGARQLYCLACAAEREVEYQREYRQRGAVKERAREYMREYMREYNRKVKAARA